MEQNFQTSFIPKKPIIPERITTSQPIGLFSIISIFVFFTIIIATGALYFYNGVLAKDLTKMENDLSLAQHRFEPSKIVELQVLDKRLKASSEILSKHIALSPVFKALGDVTMKSIGYNKFSYSFDSASKSPKIIVKMSGIAVGYRSVALQSDLFAKNKYFIDPVFSNLSLDDKGNVAFDLDFSVDPNFVDYKKTLETASENSTNTPTDNNIETLN